MRRRARYLKQRLRVPAGHLRPDLLDQAVDIFHVVVIRVFADVPPASLFEEQAGPQLGEGLVSLRPGDLGAAFE